MYALAFWYGAQLVRTEEGFTPGRCLVVSQPTEPITHNYVWGLQYIVGILKWTITVRGYP